MWKWVLGLGFRFVVIYLVDLGFDQQLCVCVYFPVWVVVGLWWVRRGESWWVLDMVVVGLGRGGLRHGGYGFVVGGAWCCSGGLWVWVLFGCCVCVCFLLSCLELEVIVGYFHPFIKK